MGKDRKNIGFNYVFPYFLQEFKEKVASLLSANGARTKPKKLDGVKDKPYIHYII